MQTPYLLLADGSLVIVSSPTITLSPTSVNYPLIRRALLDGASINEVLPLVHPEAPDGLFYAYEYSNTILIKHIKLDYSTEILAPNGDPVPSSVPSSAVYLGTYTSYDTLISSYPEYFI